ncbi:hypothetical protein [Ancylobacter polymorphus]|uniref:Ni/Co efflux regulator RcnB n=1 Tax=Ancylobacter polymorphus TaxID=223390 RepID=A0ABU0BGD0_9HYPH|nr:hypothetical protein [Ancylobacter polymorphus]MDQ0304891.1 Ni/Co efflux regulator RcnB [Ancylobacter polymorphus]
MVLRRHLAQWLKGLLATLVAIAFVLAPIASAQTESCHGLLPHHQDHDGSRHVAAIEQSIAASLHQQGDVAPEHRPAGSKTCCASSCSACQVVLARETVAITHGLMTHSGFEWIDEAGAGVAVAPILGPPRLPV